MTSPTPQPGTAPSTGNSAGAQALAASGINLPDVSSSTKSQFGLGAVAGTPVQVGGLFPVVGKDGKAITPGKDGTYTAEQVMQAFANASPSTIAQIQHQLILGGFYGSSSYTPNYGILNADDLKAFANATTVAAQTGGNLNEYLNRQAKFGEYQGVAAAVAQNGGKPRTIQKADPLQLSSLIEKEFQSLTGRKPTDAERSGFVAAYNAAYTQIQNSNYDSAAAAAGNAATVPSYSSAPPDYLTPHPADTHGGLAGFIGQAVNGTVDAANSLLAGQDMQNLQAEPQVPTQAGAGTVTQQDFDPAAFAEQYVREHATGETDAHDVASQFSNFLQIVQKGVG